MLLFIKNNTTMSDWFRVESLLAVLVNHPYLPDLKMTAVTPSDIYRILLEFVHDYIDLSALELVTLFEFRFEYSWEDVNDILHQFKSIPDLPPDHLCHHLESKLYSEFYSIEASDLYDDYEVDDEWDADFLIYYYDFPVPNLFPVICNYARHHGHWPSDWKSLDETYMSFPFPSTEALLSVFSDPPTLRRD